MKKYLIIMLIIIVISLFIYYDNKELNEAIEKCTSAGNSYSMCYNGLS